MTAVEVIRAIAAGEVDDQIEAIFDALKQRSRYVEDARAAENQVALTPGTKVEICGRISPRSLLGTRGIVLRKPSRRRGDIMVKFDHPAYLRRSLVTELGIPAECLRAVA